MPSIKSDYEDILKEAKFLVDQGYKLCLDDEYLVEFLSDGHKIIVEYDRYTECVCVKVLFDKASKGYDVLFNASHDIEIPKPKKENEKLDEVKFAFQLLKNYPEKFLNFQYMKNMDDNYNVIPDWVLSD